MAAAVLGPAATAAATSVAAIGTRAGLAALAPVGTAILNVPDEEWNFTVNFEWLYDFIARGEPVLQVDPGGIITLIETEFLTMHGYAQTLCEDGSALWQLGGG